MWQIYINDTDDNNYKGFATLKDDIKKNENVRGK